MAETIRKSVHEGDVDTELFDFVVEYVEELESTNDLMLFPVSFLIGFSEILGFKPLIEGRERRIFNLDAGTFQRVGNISERTRRGSGTEIIAALLLGDEMPENRTKNAREEALKVMLDYFMIHVPRFKDIDSYEIVKEVLNG
jgi:hypothetical protein